MLKTNQSWTVCYTIYTIIFFTVTGGKWTVQMLRRWNKFSETRWPNDYARYSRDTRVRFPDAAVGFVHSNIIPYYKGVTRGMSLPSQQQVDRYDISRSWCTLLINLFQLCIAWIESSIFKMFKPEIHLVKTILQTLT